MAANFCFPCRVCGDLMCPEDRPSPIFSTFSVLLNTAMIIWHVVGLAAYNDSCGNGTEAWTILGIVTALVNIGFAFYLYFRFAHKIKHEGGQVSKAAVKIFLYDWGVCLYMLFVVWIIVWMVMAGNAAADAANGDDCAYLIMGGIVIFIVYFVVGSFMIALSLLTECCRTPKWHRQPNPHGNPHVANHVMHQQSPGYPQPTTYQPAYQQPYGQPQQQPHYQQPQTQYPSDPYHNNQGTYPQQQHHSKRPGIVASLFGPGKSSQPPQQNPSYRA